MNALKKFLAASTIAVSAAFIAQPANAVVFSPYDGVGSPEFILSVTPGYIASYWISDGEPESPPNSSPATIKTFSEAITGLGLTSATNPGCPGSGREGLGGFSGQNKKCVGNVFTVKMNDDAYAIFVYALALVTDAFDIELDGGRKGGKLSHMDVYNSVPSAVPVPAALPLLMMGIGGIGAIARKRRKA
jgi:hypothetical protein